MTPLPKNAKYCGLLYEGCDKNKPIGNIYKIAQGRYVIACPTPYGRPWQFDWVSAEFTGKEFRRYGGLELGYGYEPHYIPKAAA